MNLRDCDTALDILIRELTTFSDQLLFLWLKVARGILFSEWPQELQDPLKASSITSHQRTGRSSDCIFRGGKWQNKTAFCCYLCRQAHLYTVALNIKVKSESVGRSVLFDSMQPHELQPARLLCPWNSPGKSTGVGSHSLLQGIFPIQGSNPGLLHCRQILYHLNHQGSPKSLFKLHSCLKAHLISLPVERWVSSSFMFAYINWKRYRR